MITLTRKSPWRQTAALARDGPESRAILAAMEPGCLVLRLKGTRREVRVPWATLYVRACMDQADALRAARRSKPGRNRSRPVRRGVLA
jgi:hypothetical protein